MEKKIKLLINGEIYGTDNWLDIISPLDNKVCGQVPALSTSDINTAFTAARKAQKAWEKNYTLANRIDYILAFKKLLNDHKEELARLMVQEIAKNTKDSLTEIERSIDFIDSCIEESKRMHPETFTGEGFNVRNKLGIFKYVPKGVILAISPYNYPINLSLSKIIPCLLTGNTVVFKPASQGSLSAAFMCKLFYDAQLPSGVINVVTGRGSVIGDALITNPEINLISFTGSHQVGNRIKKISEGKELIMELGGKDPALVLKDANLDKAAKEIISGAFSYSGQRCTAIKRVLVDETIADDLISLILAKLKNLTVGHPVDNCDIVPLISSKAADYVQSLIDEAVEKGAKLLTENRREANLIWPTIIDNVTADMQLAWEEPFGPVLPIIRCKNTSEMIDYANKSSFGLQASIFTNNINSALNLAEEIECGTVNINGKSQRGPDSFPFLGIKNSGVGVQGLRNSMQSVTRPKGIVINY